MDNTRYIEEISKYCDPLSLLVIGEKGQLIRIYCPFPVIVVQPVGNLEKGDIVTVQAIKITIQLKEVYIIEDKAYFILHFRLLL